MKQPISDSSNWESSIKKNTLHLFYWTASWLLTTALAAFGSKYLWDYQTTLTIISVVLNLAVGFGMILANKRHLNGLDELMKKIQLDAMAIALGVGLVVGLSYEQMESLKLITFEPEISHLVMLMGMTYLFAVIFGNRKYS
jgi:predicted membrane protein